VARDSSRIDKPVENGGLENDRNGPIDNIGETEDHTEAWLR
jgi:hypothetical protein